MVQGVSNHRAGVALSTFSATASTLGTGSNRVTWFDTQRPIEDDQQISIESLVRIKIQK